MILIVYSRQDLQLMKNGEPLSEQTTLAALNWATRHGISPFLNSIQWFIQN